MTKIIGDPEIPSVSLDRMRGLGGDWAVYQNHDVGHRNLGHLSFIKYGPGCTHRVPPNQHPDTPKMFGWRYLFVGYVDLHEGKIHSPQ